MNQKNSVFIATSLDGYIADKNGGIDWLHTTPNPDNEDIGYNEFMNQIDALVMGRNTYETVSDFDIEWPYKKPVFLLSNTIHEVPKKHMGKVFLIKGSLTEILSTIHQRGYDRLYIDGGTIVQSFLKEDLIDELVITTIPTVLGGGIPLFSNLSKPMNFELVRSTVYLNQLVQNEFKRKK